MNVSTHVIQSASRPATDPGPRHRRLPAPLFLAAVAALSIALALPAQAQDERVAVEAAHGTTYVNGGIGAGDEARMRKMAGDWSLRMIFSERKDDEFVAGVKLLVANDGARRTCSSPTRAR